MSTKQERFDFGAMAFEAGWPGDRVTSWMYCNIKYDTPLPHPSWTRDQIQSTSDAVLEAYLRDNREMLVDDSPQPASLSPLAHGLLYATGFALAFLFDRSGNS